MDQNPEDGGRRDLPMSTKRRNQIMISGFNRHFTIKDIKKLLLRNKINPIRLKKVQHDDKAYFFVDPAEKQPLEDLIALLQTIGIKGGPMRAELVEDDEREETRARKSERAFREVDTSLPLHEQLNDQVCSFWRYTYAEQLARKQKFARDLFESVAQGLRKTGAGTAVWLTSPKYKDQVLQEIIGSPVETKYRNKCEFTFGAGYTLGFMLGAVAESIVESISPSVHPDACPHLTDLTKTLVCDLEAFFQDKGPCLGIRPYDRIAKQGHLRLVVVRENTRREVLLLVQVHPQDLNESERAEIKRQLADHVQRVLAPTRQSVYTITSIEYQEHSEDVNGVCFTDTTEQIYGEHPHFYESLSGKRFRISLNSFFQTNLPATERLYALIKHWARLPSRLPGLLRSEALPDAGLPPVYDVKEEPEPADAGASLPIVLDICSGTGTIGILVSDVAKQVIGVEIVPSAVEDAQENAAANGVANCAFLCGRAEDKIADVVAKQPERQPMVAIVDPPRNGLHLTVVKTIRGTAGIERLIYISCDYKQATQNLVDLCRPVSKAYRLKPFKITALTPVDLFPQTKHVEVAILLER